MYSVCTLLKVVNYYDLSVLYMSVIGFQDKKHVYVVSSIQVYFGFLEFVYLCEAPKLVMVLTRSRTRLDGTR